MPRASNVFRAQIATDWHMLLLYNSLGSCFLDAKSNEGKTNQNRARALVLISPLILTHRARTLPPQKTWSASLGLLEHPCRKALDSRPSQVQIASFDQTKRKQWFGHLEHVPRTRGGLGPGQL